MEKEIYKLIEESVRDYIHELRVWGNLLNKIPKAQSIKQKKKKDGFDHIKMKGFRSTNGTMDKVNREVA